MKYIFSFLLVLSSYFSFGQMTPSEMIKVYKMDIDQFEKYALQKGYDFYEMIDKERVHGYSYSKGYGKQTKYLTLKDIFFDEGIVLFYQTSDTNEYLNFKSQMQTLGFKLFKTDSYKKDNNEKTSQINIYRNQNFEIQIYTIPSEYDSNGLFQHVKYEISISKLN